jgi:hypothetical protein
MRTKRRRECATMKKEEKGCWSRSVVKSASSKDRGDSYFCSMLDKLIDIRQTLGFRKGKARGKKSKAIRNIAAYVS